MSRASRQDPYPHHTEASPYIRHLASRQAQRVAPTIPGPRHRDPWVLMAEHNPLYAMIQARIRHAETDAPATDDYGPHVWEVWACPDGPACRDPRCLLLEREEAS